MRILFAATEVAPIAKAGGMGDVVGTLPRFLRKLGQDVRLIMPYYGFLPDKIEIPKTPIWSGAAMFQDITVHETLLPDSDIPLYLLGHTAFAPRRIYQGDDEDWRFTLFASGVVEFIRGFWKPDVVHCHDWHTGMIPVWVQPLREVKTVFTIHNLAYQGPWVGRLRQIAWCPEEMKGHNALAAALYYADRVNAVSPTYAEQIQTPEYGENLEGILTSIQDKLLGILNGLDIDSYNPATDTYITQQFTADTLPERRKNKLAMQQEAGLEVNGETYVVGMVSRLVEQKGLDLLLEVLEHFLAYTDAQFVVLGTGDRPYETALWELASRFPGRMAAHILYNDALARRIYAGSDAFLMPSRFEPCGISQMIAMRYGSVPLVRQTGGLVDTVTHHDPVQGTGTGYCFNRYEPYDLLTCMVRSWEGFHYKPQWQTLQQRGMQMDFSWDKSAKAYLDLYNAIVSPENVRKSV